MRNLFIAALSAMVACSSPLLACECGRASPACAYANGAKAIFVGKVVFTDDDGSGTFVQRTLVHFEVEESFRGLTPETHDVWIDPGSFTSCYAEYHVGERLLVFAYQGGLMPPDTTAMSLARGEGGKAKTLPPGIDPKDPPPVYLAPECSGTRLITPESEKQIVPEIEYLRRFKAGTVGPLVTGQIKLDEQFGIFDPPGVGGAVVTIARDRSRWSTQTDGEGRYTFEKVEPGEYVVTAALSDYTPRVNGIAVEVPGSGCGVANFDMIGTGVIEGQLLDNSGRPSGKTKVTILRLGTDLKPVFYGFRDTQSGADGKFRFEKVPGGDFEIGVNLASAPDLETPFPATKWSENGRSMIHLGPGEDKAIQPFRLPTPCQVRAYPVEVRWPDGRPAVGVDVWAETDDPTRGSDVGAHEMTDDNGQVRLKLLEGITYTIEAKIWVGSKNSKEVARSGGVKVKPDSKPSEINLRLSQRTKNYL